MTAPCPRRWFQIHLSTAIVLMFVAGGWTLLNVAVVYQGTVSGPNSRTYGDAQGFPFVHHIRGVRTKWTSPSDRLKGMNGFESGDAESWYVVPIIGNIAAGLAVTVLIALGSERFIRRRDARKP